MLLPSCFRANRKDNWSRPQCSRTVSHERADMQRVLPTGISLFGEYLLPALQRATQTLHVLFLYHRAQIDNRRTAARRRCGRIIRVATLTSASRVITHVRNKARARARVSIVTESRHV